MKIIYLIKIFGEKILKMDLVSNNNYFCFPNKFLFFKIIFFYWISIIGGIEFEYILANKEYYRLLSQFGKCASNFH